MHVIELCDCIGTAVYQRCLEYSKSEYKKSEYKYKYFDHEYEYPYEVLGDVSRGGSGFKPWWVNAIQLNIKH